MLDIVVIELFSHNVLRMYTFLVHLILTVMLLWTKIDSIQTSIYYDDSSLYKKYNSLYEGMVISGIIMLIVRAFFLVFEGNRVTLSGCVILLLDALACFFLAWINLDGLIWSQYIYIYVICV